MRWQRFSTTLRLCSTISTVRFCATFLISAAIRSTSSWPMPAVGSSRSIISGSSASVVAISSARLRPYGSSTAATLATSLSPTASISSSARVRNRSSTVSERQKSNDVPRWRWSAMRTFSSTLRWGNTAEIWNERAMPRRATSAGFRCVISRPLYTIRPREGVRNFVSRLKHVVLPAPFGPMRAWIVPRRTVKLTSLTATNPRNSLVSCDVSRMTSAVTGLYHHSRSATMSSEGGEHSMPRISRREFLLTSAVAAVAAGPLAPAFVRGQTSVKIGTAVLGDYGLAGPVVVGIEKGLFTAQGLAVEFVPFRGGPDLSKGVLSGDVLLGISGATDVLVFRERGAPVKMIASHVDGNDFTLNVSLDVKSVADLKGKAIGVTSAGATTWLFARMVAKQQGWNPDKDVQIVALGGLAAQLAALSRKGTAGVVG